MSHSCLIGEELAANDVIVSDVVDDPVPVGEIVDPPPDEQTE